MRKILTLAAAGSLWLAASASWAQTIGDPDIVGPGRRAAGAAGRAAGAPGVEQRIEDRQQMRDLRRADDNPNAGLRANARANDPLLPVPDARITVDANPAAPAARRDFFPPDARITVDANPRAPRASVDVQIENNDPERWRYVRHDNWWWYYTPQQRWRYYYNNAWVDYDPNTFVAPRYETNFRGPAYREPAPAIEYRTPVYEAQRPVYRPYRRGLFGRYRY